MPRVLWSVADAHTEAGVAKVGVPGRTCRTDGVERALAGVNLPSVKQKRVGVLLGLWVRVLGG